MHKIYMEISALKEMLLQQSYLQKTFFTVDEVVLYLGISKSEIYKKTSKRQLPFYKTGKIIYFDRKELDTWILDHRVKSQEEIQKEIDNVSKKGGSHGK